LKNTIKVIALKFPSILSPLNKLITFSHSMIPVVGLVCRQVK